ncbi:hypothetical protein OE903_23075 [Bacillus sp. B6(2022)]|nr:hypothetical protein [Bacillus sp. B6(2022)]
METKDLIIDGFKKNLAKYKETKSYRAEKLLAKDTVDNKIESVNKIADGMKNNSSYSGDYQEALSSLTVIAELDFPTGLTNLIQQFVKDMKNVDNDEDGRPDPKDMVNMELLEAYSAFNSKGFRTIEEQNYEGLLRQEILERMSERI